MEWPGHRLPRLQRQRLTLHRDSPNNNNLMTTPPSEEALETVHQQRGAGKRHSTIRARLKDGAALALSSALLVGGRELQGEITPRDRDATMLWFCVCSVNGEKHRHRPAVPYIQVHRTFDLKNPERNTHPCPRDLTTAVAEARLLLCSHELP